MITAMNPNVIMWKDKEIPRVSLFHFESNYQEDPLIHVAIQVWFLNEQGEHEERTHECYLTGVKDYKYKKIWQVEFKHDDAREIELSPYAKVGDYL